MAAMNPGMLKLTSVADAMATPPMMGTSVATSARLGTTPVNAAERPTENTGSNALMVCVNDTATLPKLTFVNALPSICTPPSTASGLSMFIFITGLDFNPTSQHAPANAEPTASSKNVTVNGIGTAFKIAF